MKSWRMQKGFVISVDVSAPQFDFDMASKWNELITHKVMHVDFPMHLGSVRGITDRIFGE